MKLLEETAAFVHPVHYCKGLATPAFNTATFCSDNTSFKLNHFMSGFTHRDKVIVQHGFTLS